MAVLDALRPSSNGSEDGTSTKVDRAIQDRITRGSERLKQLAPERDENWAFFRGKQFAYVDDKQTLRFQPTVTTVNGGGKPQHRLRRSYNLIVDAVQHEVSSATQRVPSYEVVPSTSDADDVSAAKTAETVALYGYDKWGVREAVIETVTNALVADEGFVWPYFDNTIGPYAQTDNGTVGQGEIKLRCFSGNQVGWEPGTRFEDSPWHFVQYAAPPSEIRQMEGFLGGKLSPDADSDRTSGDPAVSRKTLTLVTEYLERPTAQNPYGSWVVMANNKRVLKDREYPCARYEGLDTPVLHKLSYIIDPDSDRDMGLVRHLKDPQRLFNQVRNKAVEWAQMTLAPQAVVTPGLMGKQKLTDEAGLLLEIPDPKNNFMWRPVPQIPPELFQLEDRAKDSFGTIAAQNDIPSQVEAGRAIQALIERDAGRRQAFIAQLAEWHSQVMRHCLTLVQEHYTEERLIQVKGRFSWDSVQNFMGAKLRSQLDVRVFPASIEPLSKEAQETRVTNWAQLGWISPQAAMQAISTGTTAQLIEDVNDDVQWASRILRRAREGPQALFAMPSRVENDPITGLPIPDPQTGQPMKVPGWMPRPFHNVPVLMSVFESYMKTEDYETLDPPMQDAINEVYSVCLQLKAKKEAEAAAAQQAQAEDLGQQNAAKPQLGKAMPDQQSTTPPDSGPTPNSPNQPMSQGGVS